MSSQLNLDLLESEEYLSKPSESLLEDEFLKV
jgi:hypothetical protein